MKPPQESIGHLRISTTERRDKEPDLEAHLNQLGAEEDKKASAEVPRSPDGI